MSYKNRDVLENDTDILDIQIAALESLPKEVSKNIPLSHASTMYKTLKNKLNKLTISRKEIENFKPDSYTASIKSPINFQAGFLDRFSEGYELRGETLPWEKTESKFRFRDHEVTIWSGYSGHKKSLVMGQTIFDIVSKNKEKAIIASMEMPAEETLARMAIQACGNQKPDHYLLIDFLEYLHEKLYIFDQTGSINKSLMLKMVEYCAAKLKIKHIVIDSLMKCGMATDDYTGQKDFIGALTDIAHKYPIHIHLVAHMRKPVFVGKYPHVPNKYEISGGADIFNQVDNVLIFWTNIQKKLEKYKPQEQRKTDVMEIPEQILAIDKQRNGQFEGPVSLEFCDRSAQIVEYRMKQYFHLFQKRNKV